MDNLAHSLVGLLLARVGIPRDLPRRAWIGVVAANAPDLDLLASTSPAAYLVAHRHLTHAVVAIPVMAACAVGLVWAGDRLWRKWRRGEAAPFPFARAWLAALLPAASHPLLDWMNSYAIRPWLPFDGAWSSANLLFVIDLWIWGALAVAALTPHLLRWGQLGGERAALWALVALAGYIGWQSTVTSRALQTARAEAPPAAQQVAVFPAPFDPRLRTRYVELPDGHLIGETRMDKPKRRDLVDAAWQTEIGEAYQRFALYPVEILEPNGDGWRVRLTDARFIRFGKPGFGCVVELDAAGRVLQSRFEF